MISDICTLIPHRTPFLFVDTIISADESGVVGQRTFTHKDFFFEGHFPEYPIVPGVIVVEAMAQCGGAGVKYIGTINQEHLFFLATIDKVKFRKPIFPDDTVRMEIENIKISSRMVKQRGKTYKENGDIAVEAEWMCIASPSPNSYAL